MKKIIAMLAAITILASANSYASAAPSCPTIEKIRTATFTRAYKSSLEWIAITSIIDTNGMEWTVGVDFVPGDLKSEQGALKYLHEQMQIAPMIEPEASEDQGSIICHYAKNYGFELVAINPAIHPNLAQYFKK